MTREELNEALKDVTVSLIGAHSLLSLSPKIAAPSNKMFDQMLADYQASIDRAHAVLNADHTEWPRGTQIRVEHDGFEGFILNPYITREGKRGQVCQLNGTRIVHVYGEKWLIRT